MKCRICGSENYKSVLDLGSIYPSNFVDNGPVVEPKPLHLVQCTDCELVQLEETFDLDAMYKDHYWYKSSLNPSMIKALKDVVDKALVYKPNPKYVLDIGANDGTLLSFYDRDVFKVGVDPSKNVRTAAEEICDVFINDYFSLPDPNPFTISYPYVKYDIITSIAMFYDLENPNKFIRDVKELLDDNGIWIIQFTDLLSTIKLNAFDNICHEHIEYYSLGILDKLLKSHALTIFDLEYNNVNGGSIRVYVNKNKRFIKPIVKNTLELERDYIANNPITKFSNKIIEQKNKLLSLVFDLRAKNKLIYALGASTKGNTLLQYYGLDFTIIDKALEINKDKFGKFTVGSNILIIPEEIGLEEHPDYLLVLPWGFREYFIDKFQTYIDNGMKLIFPLPEVNVIERCYHNEKH